MNDEGFSRTQAHAPRKRARPPRAEATADEKYEHDYAAMADADIEEQLESGNVPSPDSEQRVFLEIAGITREPFCAGSGGQNYLAQKKLYDESRHKNSILEPIVCASRVNMRNMCEMAKEVNVWCETEAGLPPVRATWPEDIMRLAIGRAELAA